MKLDRVILCLMLMLGLLPAFVAKPAAAQQGLDGWTDSGLRIVDGVGLCFDATRPGAILIADENSSSRYEWGSRQRTILNPRRFDTSRCAIDGSLFVQQTENWPGAQRFTVADPTPRFVEHLPTAFATDGSPQVYSLDNTPVAGQSRSAWSSPDGGTTWHQIATNVEGEPAGLLVTAADGRALYLLTRIPGDQYDGLLDYRIYFSADAGATWELRSSGQVRAAIFNDPGLNLVELPGRATPRHHPRPRGRQRRPRLQPPHATTPLDRRRAHLPAPL